MPNARSGKKGAPISFVVIACLLFAFGVIAQNVIQGRSFAFDQKIIVALRDPANPSAHLGPEWVQEAARDLTGLGSIIVVVMITLAVSGYLFIARKHAAAWLRFVAVFGAIMLNDLLKAVLPVRALIFSIKPCGFSRLVSRVATLSSRRLPISRLPRFWRKTSHRRGLLATLLRWRRC